MKKWLTRLFNLFFFNGLGSFDFQIAFFVAALFFSTTIHNFLSPISHRTDDVRNAIFGHMLHLAVQLLQKVVDLTQPTGHLSVSAEASSTFPGRLGKHD